MASQKSTFFGFYSTVQIFHAMNDIDKLTAKSLHWNFKLFMMQMFVILFFKYLCILSSFSQECFEILTRSTKVLREEYLDRHEKARREIERRCASLEAKKSQQHMTLVKLTQVCLLPIFS